MIEPSVVAVVVTTGASAYLHRTLEGLAAQVRAPEVTLVVDVSSAERPMGSGAPLEEIVHTAGLEAVSAVRVVRAPDAPTFGAAVREGLQKYTELVHRAIRRRSVTASARPETWHGVTGELSPVTSTDRVLVDHLGTGSDPGADESSSAENSWLWLLHDDSAPAPGALAALLRATEHSRTVAVAGCKQRDWTDPDRLLEVGLSTTRRAQRALDLEEDEIDQGQRDHREDVLAVGTAGMMVRGDVWESLGGLDPRLGPFGDGLEFCRRARLAGHRVIVVPGAVVLHARASFEGLRGRPEEAASLAAPTSRAAALRPDRRRSFRARRRSQLYNAVLAAPAGTAVLMALGYVLLAPLRALGRLLGKEPGLAWAELAAAGGLLGDLSALRARRRSIAATRTVSPKDLQALETTPGRIRAARRERRRHRAALRQMRAAPSELEMRERAALAAQRRRWAALVLLASLGAGTALSGHLLGAFPTGGAIEALPATLTQLWHDALSDWIPTGLGTPGPADPLQAVLAVLAAPGVLLGAAPSTSLTLILVLAPLAAGLGAWVAAGAATRRASVRAWAALVWAVSPPVVLGLLEGRVGVALAAAALPWVGCSIAWVCGARRRDLLLPGLVGARRRHRRPALGPEPAPGEGPQHLDVFADLLDEGEAAEDLLAGGPRAVRRDPGAQERPETQTAPPSFDSAPSRRSSGHNRTVSLMAAAGGGLALSVATAGVPALLPAAVVLLVLLAVVVPFGRRYLVGMLIPPVTLHLPLLIAVATGEAPWRGLVADTGVPLATLAAPGWAVLLGWPEDLAAGSLLSAAWLTPTVQSVIVLAWCGLLVPAALALAHRGTGARAVRAGWLVAVVGALLGVLLPQVQVAVGSTTAGTASVVTAWGGSGTLLLVAGLLLAVTAADGARHERRSWVRFHHRGDAFGGLEGRSRRAAVARRTVGATLAAVVGLAPLCASAVLVVAATTSPLGLVQGRGSQVPALSTQLAAGPEAARTLVVSLADDTLRATLLRNDGRLLTETSTLAQARRLDVLSGAADDPFGDAMATTAARLVGGDPADVAEELGRFAVGVVLVPPVESTSASAREHDDLVSRLDGVPGLERVTVNQTGTVWRVATEETGGSISRATVVAEDGALLQDLTAGQVRVEDTLEPGEPGRLLVVAERADRGWRASLDGRGLQSVTTEDGRQAFALPAEGGALVVDHTSPWRWPVTLLQLAVFVFTAITAFPVRRGWAAE